MNYPIWQVPAPGLVIALVSIAHVFISHFAVGGGLFLVLTERRARQRNDALLLAYVRRLSRFFLLLTLVFGAVTGVGIWFAIGLVHPQATSSLINTFVWGWAIEWTMFITEIVAAMVYYYGWDRLPARTHLTVGWIYFITAWGSLAVITGILTYMMTPGGWLTERSFWSGFLNETYLPSLVMRTFVCVGLAGVYALLAASWSGDARLKSKVARYAGLGWVLPMAVVVPLSLIWYLAAAAGAGIPAAEILGADGTGLPAILKALFTADGTTGHPVAQRAALTTIVAATGVILMTLFLVARRRRNYGPIFTGLLTFLALVAMGGGEWMRADLRKPYVIGGFMFVNGVRLPPPAGAIRAPADIQVNDPYALDVLRRDGMLAHARWSQVQPAAEAAALEEPEARAEALFRTGRELFKLACTKCHTTDGYQGIRPLVAGRSTSGLQTILGHLARPVNREGRETGWDDPDLRLATWRGRRMPPFPGNQAEQYALAVYLSRLGGDDRAGFERQQAHGSPAAGPGSGREETP